MHKHRHLIQEIKDELDWATREGSRVEDEVLSLEVSYNRRLKELNAAGNNEGAKALMAEKEQVQEECRLGELFAIQRRAARRFSLVSRLYELACGEPDPEKLRDSITSFVFRSDDDVKGIEGAADALKDLSVALNAYFHDELSDANDQDVRDAWFKIESALKTLGRQI